MQLQFSKFTILIATLNTTKQKTMQHGTKTCNITIRNLLTTDVDPIHKY